MIEYITAFDMLASRRTNGMSPNPISLTDVQAYVELFGCSNPRDFVKFIILMDVVFLEVIRKAQK